MEPAPSAGRRRSRAAGLRAALGAGSALLLRVRPAPQVREPERARPGRRRRRFLPEGCGTVRAGGPGSAPSGGRQPRRLPQRAAAAARAPPGFPSPSPAPRVPSLADRPPLSAPRGACSRPREPCSPALSLPLAPFSAPSRPRPRRDPPRLPGAGARAPRANHRPGWAAGRAPRPRPPHSTPGPPGSLSPGPPGSPRRGAGPRRSVRAGLAFRADPPSSPAFSLLWGEGGLGISGR